MRVTNGTVNSAVIVGLTGQSGAGKTLACDYFKKCGFAIINCDLVAREVVGDGTNCLNDLALAFSNIILNEDGTLNRKALSGIVFNNKEKLKQLNKTIFPYILSKINVQINTLNKNGFDVIILDAPTLFESGANELCDIIISVIANKDTRINRIIERDKLSAVEATARINSQYDEEFFIKNSNFIIRNDSSYEQLSNSLKLAEIFINTYSTLNEL